jgi:hypothetical protein
MVYVQLLSSTMTVAGSFGNWWRSQSYRQSWVGIRDVFLKFFHNPDTGTTRTRLSPTC